MRRFATAWGQDFPGTQGDYYGNCEDGPVFSAKSKRKPDLVGRWKNELKSVMTIKTVADNEFSGQYTSAVSASHKQVKGTLCGTIAGDSIALLSTGSPRSNPLRRGPASFCWTKRGRCTSYTLWQLSHGVDDPKDTWQSIISGSDIFKKMQK